MITGMWHKAGVAGLLAAALGSCAHEERRAEQPPPAAPQPEQQAVQQPPPQAVPQPPQRRDEVAEAQRRLETAHQDVTRAQEQLALAQQREEQERANVQQLEIRARQDLERASQLSQDAERAQGLEAAIGRVVQATPSRVLLETRDGRTMSFRLDDRTRVLVGAEQRSVSEIQQGADARVAFDQKGAERTAVTIRLAPLGTELGATPQAPPSSPAEPEAPPSR